MAHASSDNLYGTSTHIVDASAAKGSHTTIASAVAAASSGDTIFVRPGTYTEDVTVDKTLNFCAYSSGNRYYLNSVNLVGKYTIATNSIKVAFDGFQTNTNSDYFISLTGTGTQVLLQNCYIQASNNTAINCTGDSASNLVMENCGCSLSSTYALFTTTNTPVWIKNCWMLDVAGTLSPSTSSNSTITIRNSSLSVSLSVSGAAQLKVDNCKFAGTNATYLTTAGTGSSLITNTSIISGSSSCISIGAGTTVEVCNCTLSSTNTNPITGAGTLQYSSNVYDNTGIINNVTTQTPYYIDAGKFMAKGQPCFMAYLATSDNNATGDGTQYTLGDTDIGTTLTEIFDQDSNFTPGASGGAVFTAPVTGRYIFVVGMAYSVTASSATTQAIGKLITSNRTYEMYNSPTRERVTNYYGVNGWLTFNNSIIADMDAADTAQFWFKGLLGSKTTNIIGQADLVTYLGGSLIA